MNDTQLKKCTNKVKEVTYREPKDDNSFVLKYHKKRERERELIALIHNITNTIYPKLEKFRVNMNQSNDLENVFERCSGEVGGNTFIPAASFLERNIVCG